MSDDPRERLRRLAERRKAQEQANDEAARRLQEEGGSFLIAFNDWQREVLRPELDAASALFAEVRTMEVREYSELSVRARHRWTLRFQPDAQARKVEVVPIDHDDPDQAVSSERRSPKSYELSELDADGVARLAADFVERHLGSR